MEQIFLRKYEITPDLTDPSGRLHPAGILYLLQETAGDHCRVLGVEDEKLDGLFWAVLRYRVEVDRLPRLGEEITLRTWPMPTTRVAYPRAAEALDTQGNVLFRLISVWVLMDGTTRQMVLPGKSGVEVPGVLTGTELAVPAGIRAEPGENTTLRTVTGLELDKNRHMNNTKYLHWATQLLPADFAENHRLESFTACYFNEAKEGDELALLWSLDPAGRLYLDSYRRKNGEIDKTDRVFSAELNFIGIM